MDCCSTAPVQERYFRPPEIQSFEPPEHPHERVEVKLYFRDVAKAYCAAFFLTMIFAGAVTFTATEYSSETDKITLFYGMFNPCIWFDHYPAKALAMTGMGFFIVIGIGFSILYYLHIYCEKRVFRSVWAGGVVAAVTMADLVFVNVFTTNLYPLEAERRRLHGIHAGVNGTMTLFAEGEQPVNLLGTAMSMDPEEVSIISLHTAFYIAWLVGQVFFCIFLLNAPHHKSRMMSWSPGSRAWFAVATFVGIFGMAMHAGAMIVIVLQNKPMVDWYNQETLKSSIQEWVVYIDGMTYSSSWGWLPVMLYRLMLPEGTGVMITCRLRETKNHDGHVLPEWWIGRCLQLIAAVLAFGGVFHKAMEQSSGTWLLSAAIGSKPYAYFAAPAYLGAIILLVIGIGLTVVQKRLSTGQMPYLLIANGLCNFFALFGCLLTILEREQFCWIFFFTSVSSIFVWVFQLNWGKDTTSSIVFLAGGSICIFGMQYVGWGFYYGFLAWMCCYTRFVDDGHMVYVTVERLEDVDEGEAFYQPVGTLQVCQGQPVYKPGYPAQLPSGPVMYPAQPGQVQLPSGPVLFPAQPGQVQSRPPVWY